MNLENKINPKSGRSKLMKAVLAAAVVVGAVKSYLPLNLPTKDNTKQVSVEGYQKPVALVGDDSGRTRDRVEAYLRGRGYEVVQASTIDEAKEIIRENQNVVKLVTDMDYAGSYDDFGFFEREIAHRIDGFKLVKWLNSEQEKGNYRNVKSITLHSTTLNKGDLEGFCARPVTRYVVSKIGKMGDAEINYNAQPKTAILDSVKK